MSHTVLLTETDFGLPPEGHKWKIIGKGSTRAYVLDNNDKPIAIKKRRKSRPLYSVPDGGFTSHITPDYDINVHCKLRPHQFQDPLHYAQWEKWYYEQFVARCERTIQEFLVLGTTSEERKQNQAAVDAMRSIENYVARQNAKNNTNLSIEDHIKNLLSQTNIGKSK